MNNSQNIRFTLFPIVFLLLFIGSISPSTAFVHPGLLSTQTDFDRMQTQVNAGTHPWIDSYNIISGNVANDFSYQPTPFSVVIRGSGNGTDNIYYLEHDIAVAYQNTLMWKITGDNRYADVAVRICNGWSSTLTDINSAGNGWDYILAAGIQGYEFANAAENLYGYSGWTDANKAQFQNMMINVFYRISHGWIINHYGACPDNAFASWDLLSIACILATGVVCDDQAKYNEALNYLYSGNTPARLDWWTYEVFPGLLGQQEESGRDQGHAGLSIGLVANICQMAGNQGDDLYGYQNNKFLSAAEYFAKYNLGSDVPYSNYQNCSGTVLGVISDSARGDSRPYWAMIYNHYANLKGIASPWTKLYMAKEGIEGGGGNYGNNTGGYDQLGFTTLICSLPPYTGNPAPTGVTAWVTGPSITLSWWGSSTAVSYIVSRSTTTGGPYTPVATGITSNTYTDTAGINSGVTYYYVIQSVSAANTSGYSAELAATANTQLTGTVIGTQWSYGGWNGSYQTGMTSASLFDGNLDGLHNFFDGPDANGDWAGIDTGANAAYALNMVKYCPRTGYGSRMVGGQFQGSNTPDFSSDVVTLYTIPSGPSDNVLATAVFNNTQAFRYYRYLSPNNGWCNACEIQFYGDGGAPQPDYCLTTSPSYISILPGATGSTTVTATPFNGFTNSVTLSASGLPTGVTASFSPVSPTSTSTITLSAGSNAAAGTYPITITGISGSISRSTTINLTIIDFSLSASPSSLSVAPSNTNTSTVTVNPMNGFTGTVTLSVSGLPTGVTGSFNPVSTTDTSLLTIAASSTLSPSFATVTITGTCGSLSHAISIPIMIGAPNGVYKLINRKSGLAMNVSGGSTSNGAAIIQWPFTNAPNDKWILTGLSNNQYQIMGVGSGRMLDITNGSTADGAIVEIWDSNNNPNQHFAFLPTDSGYYNISPMNSSKSIGIYNELTSQGAGVIQKTLSNALDQQWTFIPVDGTALSVTFGNPSPAANLAGWNNSAVTIPYTLSDNISALATATPGSPLTFSSEGASQAQTVTATDNAGNNASFTSPVVNIDMTPPATTISGITSGAITNSSVTITLNATDNLSGIANTYYTIDGGVQQTYNTAFTVSRIGVHKMNYWSVDMAGNTETGKSVSFSITTAPFITSLTPSSITGATTFTLTVNGANFVNGSIIKWNGTNMATTFVSATQLTATVNKYYTTLSSYPGSATVSVLNPDGTRSTGVTLTITQPIPVPTITSLSPSSVLGAKTFTLTVNGSNFVSGSIIKFNGTNMTTTYVSPTQLTASINKYYTTLTIYPGLASISVLNPDGARSSGATLTITAPLPAISSLSPSSITGATTFTLTVNGSNFISGAVIKWNGTNMTTTYVSSTQLTAVINKYYDTLTSYPGSATISVLNPDSGRTAGASITITTP